MKFDRFYPCGAHGGFLVPSETTCAPTLNAFRLSPSQPVGIHLSSVHPVSSLSQPWTNGHRLAIIIRNVSSKLSVNNSKLNFPVL